MLIPSKLLLPTQHTNTFFYTYGIIFLLTPCDQFKLNSFIGLVLLSQPIFLRVQTFSLAIMFPFHLHSVKHYNNDIIFLVLTQIPKLIVLIYCVGNLKLVRISYLISVQRNYVIGQNELIFGIYEDY